MACSLSVEALALPLVHPFRIARGEESAARTVLLRLHDAPHEALGESAPIPRYRETTQSVLAFYRQSKLDLRAPAHIEAMLAQVPTPAARCALDLALHDLLGKRLGAPLYELLGLDPAATPTTSFTIGIADPATTLAKVREIREHPILKIKLGLGNDSEQIETIAAIRAQYRGILRIDANEAWSAEQAVRLLRELARYEIEFCEQPIPAGRYEELRYVHERSPIPIVADEDAKDAHDLFALRGCVSGINVKLVKCGGIRGALAMIATARALDLRVMLGCMVESAILATAAAHLSPLVDWADIDGPFLVACDPFVGLTYERGRLILPQFPGLGVRERALT